MLDVFSENSVMLIVFAVTLWEKAVGTIFECSRAQIEAEWLVSVSSIVTHEHSVSMVFSPVFWMSVAELLSTCSGNVIKIGVDMMNDSNRVLLITCAVFFFVFWTIYLQVFMIRGVQTNKRD